MRERLTIAAVQPLIRSHDVAGNAGRHRDAILAAGADVVVFPELSLTGYELDSAALSASDERLTPIADACRTTDSTALVGAPVAGISGGRSIGMLAVNADGAQIAYRKMWLGGDERAHLVAGDIFMLCTDGLTRYFDDEAGLGEHMFDEASNIPKKLVDVALSQGGRDNVTVVVVSVAEESIAAPNCRNFRRECW